MDGGKEAAMKVAHSPGSPCDPRPVLPRKYPEPPAGAREGSCASQKASRVQTGDPTEDIYGLIASADLQRQKYDQHSKKRAPQRLRPSMDAEALRELSLSNASPSESTGGTGLAWRPFASGEKVLWRTGSGGGGASSGGD